MKYIICAAINYDGVIVCGLHHSDVVRSYFKLTKQPTMAEHTRGFITNTNEFVGRKEAAEIAYKAGQIKEKANTLISEDLY